LRYTEQIMTTATPIIQVKNLQAGYEDLAVLENINFDVYQGERFVIVGPSGCGKSTLLRHMVGLNPTTRGSIHINGVEIAGEDQALSQQIVQRIGFLFQSSALLSSLTVAENIGLPIHEYTDMPETCVDAVVRIKLAQVNLTGYGNHMPAELSGGMQKRAALARAMALGPKILFFDEPSAGLDPITSAELDNLILYLNTALKTTMVIVSHELASIFAVGQRVIMLDQDAKGIIAEGDPVELRDHSPNPQVRRFFNREVEQSSNSQSAIRTR
jgi:phospholipid/cholesterol/gamma-HCH transport system ATP-binding protein